MWKCWVCKGTIYAALAVLLYFAIQAIMTGGALGTIFSGLGAESAAGLSGFRAWTAFITWLSPEGATAAVRTALGYKVFAAILAAGAAAIFLLADIVAWLVCLICKAMGACDECETPSIFR